MGMRENRECGNSAERLITQFAVNRGSDSYAVHP